MRSSRSSSAPAEVSRLRDALGAAIPVVASAVFLALWWRSYLAVTNDGWHFFGAWRILNGEVPYRDYYLFIPPFHQLKIAAIVGVFGKTLIAAQAVGFAERLVLAAVVYFWLRRAYGPAASALGSTFGLFVYYSASSETLSSMIHEAAMWAVCAGASAAAALAHRRRSLWLLAGLLAGVAFLTKQTSGAGIAIALFSFAGWRALREAETRKDLLAMAAGWCIPTSPVAAWLYFAGALPAFLDQVYLRGPASKGGPYQILVRPMLMLVDNVWDLRYTIAALAAFAVLVWATRLRSDPEIARFGLAAPAAAIAAAIAAGAWLGFSGGFAIHPFLERAPLAITLRVTLLFVLAMSIMAGPRWAREAEPRGAQVFLLAWVSLWITVFSSLSWALMIIMALPGVPFLAAAALSATPSGWIARVWRPGVAALLLGGVAFFTHAKTRIPFHWSGWREAGVAEATEESELPLLRGLRLSPETKAFVESVTKAVQEGSNPEDAVFVYPHMPLFYLLADRKPATFAPVHFFDVCPDYLAREDAARLRANPPAVIVDFRHTEAEIEDAELIFRGGARSGQRDIMAAIDELTRKEYDLVEDLRTPRTDHSVRVWRRAQQ